MWDYTAIIKKRYDLNQIFLDHITFFSVSPEAHLHDEIHHSKLMQRISKL
jgi:hypothetical protein